MKILKWIGLILLILLIFAVWSFVKWTGQVVADVRENVGEIKDGIYEAIPVEDLEGYRDVVVGTGDDIINRLEDLP